MAVALLCVPIALLLAVVLPGNRMLPFGDLAALPFYVLWGVAASRGNMVRGLINAVVILVRHPLDRHEPRATHHRARARRALRAQGLGGRGGHYREWSGVALGSHVVPWIVLQLFQPPTFLVGVAAALAYGGIWWWVRDEIRDQFAAEIRGEAEASSGRRSHVVKCEGPLPDALHARPANLLVRLASQHDAVVRLRNGERCANARKILDVLSLGRGERRRDRDTAEGEGAEAAARALRGAVARGTSTADLVPERGSGRGRRESRSVRAARAAPCAQRRTDGGRRGAATERGARAARRAPRRGPSRSCRSSSTPAARGARPLRAGARHRAGGRAAVVERIGEGAKCEDAVLALTESAPTDPHPATRAARLLEALADDEAMADALARMHAATADVVVVAEELTPSLVARLPPRVRGIVAVDDSDVASGAVRTSHAAILARGRELPLALVPSHVAAGDRRGRARRR